MEIHLFDGVFRRNARLNCWSQMNHYEVAQSHIILYDGSPKPTHGLPSSATQA